MGEAVKEVLIGCLGALITAIFTYRSDKNKTNVDREDMYAKHTDMLWRKIDRQSKTIDKLTTQVEELREENLKLVMQVRKLSAQVASLKSGGNQE